MSATRSLTVDALHFPGASGAFRYDLEGEGSSIGTDVLVKAGDVDGLLSRTQTGVGGAESWTVVIGVLDLDGYCARGRL